MRVIAALTTREACLLDGAHIDAFPRDQVETFAHRSTHPKRLLDDYPGECYPGDVYGCSHVIKRADTVLDRIIPSHEPALRITGTRGTKHHCRLLRKFTLASSFGGSAAALSPTLLDVTRIVAGGRPGHGMRCTIASFCKLASPLWATGKYPKRLPHLRDHGCSMRPFFADTSGCKPFGLGVSPKKRSF